MTNATIKFTLDGKQMEFNLITNLHEKDVEPVLNGWANTTDQLTEELFIKFINSIVGFAANPTIK